MDSTNSYSVAVRQSLFENPEITRIYMAGNADPDALDELDLVRYRVLIQNIMWAFWNMYSQGELTGLSLEVWRVQGPVVRRILCSPGGQWFWEHYQNEFTLDFRQEIERVLTEGDSPT